MTNQDCQLFRYVLRSCYFFSSLRYQKPLFVLCCYQLQVCYHHKRILNKYNRLDCQFHRVWLLMLNNQTIDTTLSPRRRLSDFYLTNPTGSGRSHLEDWGLIALCMAFLLFFFAFSMFHCFLFSIVHRNCNSPLCYSFSLYFFVVLYRNSLFYCLSSCQQVRGYSSPIVTHTLYSVSMVLNDYIQVETHKNELGWE